MMAPDMTMMATTAKENWTELINNSCQNLIICSELLIIIFLIYENIFGQKDCLIYSNNLYEK
jgi:hypothetical protein